MILTVPTVKLLEQAEFEVKDACDWYEEQQKGLSLKFRRSLKYTLGIIEETPLLYAPKYKGDLHFAPLRKFPYIVIYWIDLNLSTITVVSVFHTKRNPTKFE